MTVINLIDRAEYDRAVNPLGWHSFTFPLNLTVNVRGCSLQQQKGSEVDTLLNTGISSTLSKTLSKSLLLRLPHSFISLKILEITY
ncbi:hypothetical protein XELAEV_18016413mg [Xenopus laevis]|uniref:Uncharacterized protein n=1 Tax=Xenopus laevis TaxID=8355 RepID=A0A974DJY4_XENLA|nr:hypothetical protein XELAEV_18016413mg [Xenopus laevis]